MNTFKNEVNKIEKRLRGKEHSKSFISHTTGLAVVVVYEERNYSEICLNFYILRRNLDEAGEDVSPKVFSARVEKILAPKSSGDEKITLGLVDIKINVINPSKIWINGNIELMRYSGVPTPSVRKFIIFFDGKNQPTVEFRSSVENRENEILQQIEEADFPFRAHSAAKTYQRAPLKCKVKGSEKII